MEGTGVVRLVQDGEDYLCFCSKSDEGSIRFHVTSACDSWSSDVASNQPGCESWRGGWEKMPFLLPLHRRSGAPGRSIQAGRSPFAPDPARIRTGSGKRKIPGESLINPGFVRKKTPTGVDFEDA
ncbi:protein PAXX isoform X2 [Podarcis lilfordi]|uniref:Protein PAXX isoform X2 n=1 Tax=Podarcis lilfordi TaxID=74358 RepID=A0AA35LEJ8_9SAUR|nr:protein PAXX isoform X2 [Podarcis lilfordi]